MPNELLPQDTEVLDKAAKEFGLKAWENPKQKGEYPPDHDAEMLCKYIECAVVLARQAETQRCLKEIDKMEFVVKERVSLWDKAKRPRCFAHEKAEGNLQALTELKKRLQENEKND